MRFSTLFTFGLGLGLAAAAPLSKSTQDYRVMQNIMEDPTTLPILMSNPRIAEMVEKTKKAIDEGTDIPNISWLKQDPSVVEMMNRLTEKATANLAASAHSNDDISSLNRRQEEEMTDFHDPMYHVPKTCAPYPLGPAECLAMRMTPGLLGMEYDTWRGWYFPLKK